MSSRPATALPAAPAPAQPAPPRQARSRATRRRLLEATIAGLVETGLAGTTTSEVVRRAGVSQGALFKHFASKDELLGAAIERLFAELIEAFQRDFAVAAREEDRLGAALRALWARFGEPRLHAVFELYAAARTDATLRARLGPVLDRHRENLQREARQLFPEVAGRGADFEIVVDVVVAAMQGGALAGLVHAAPEREARALALLERLVRRELGVGDARDPSVEGAH